MPDPTQRPAGAGGSVSAPRLPCERLDEVFSEASEYHANRRDLDCIELAIGEVGGPMTVDQLTDHLISGARGRTRATPLEKWGDVHEFLHCYALPSLQDLGRVQFSKNEGLVELTRIRK